MKKTTLAICLASALGAQAAQTSLIDAGWKFSLDSINWQAVDLPHDWSIAGPYDRKAAADNDGAYLPTGKGYYTRAINLTPKAGQRLLLRFDGAYMNSEVRVNGHLAGGHPYGYSTFFVDITPYVHDGENQIEVTVDNSKQRNSRWYTGSGIYRHVWLEESGEVRIAPWGVAITTPDPSRTSAAVDFSIEVENKGATPKKVSIEVTCDGKSDKTTAVVLPNASDTAKCELMIANPKLWSPDSPSLYVATVKVKDENGKVIDEASETFGIRKFEYSAADGLRLNGEPLKLNGGCVHHDNGILGAASFDAAEVRKAKLMKDAGFNAARTSHNVPSPAFLDACDSLGLIVIDEAFDGWRDSKTEHDYHELIDQWWEKDIEAMVKRDRNHPSIFAWSIGNEVIERKKIEVVTTARKLAEKCRELDPTRPVTSALAAWDSDWEIYDPLAAEHDIVGYNYMIHKAESDHQRVPDRVMWQTESYPRDAFSNWAMVEDHPYVIGDFVWTALDYVGESGIGRHFYQGQTEGEHYQRQQWPWHGSFCGDVDLTGLVKPIGLYRGMLHNQEEGPQVHIAVREPDGYIGEIRETQWGTYPMWQSWTWPGWEGKPIEVVAMSTYPKVNLYVDGKLADSKPTDRSTEFMALFTIPYQPGEIEVRGVDAQGNEHGSSSLATAGKPAAIRLTPDHSRYAADGSDVAFFVAEVVDNKGRVDPNATNLIDFTVSGPGSIIATGSADMTDMTPYTEPSRKAWHGRVLVAVRMKEKPGSVTLRAVSKGLRPAKSTVKAL